MSTAFIASFTVIFRESLEAVLIVAAIYAYLTQIGECQAKRIINYAWISALFAKRNVSPPTNKAEIHA